METNIIKGEDLGSFEAIALSLGVSKNENRDGKKSRFMVVTYQDTYSGREDPVKDIIFEENIGTDMFERMKTYIMKDAEGNDLKDSKNGRVVDIDAIRDAAATGDRKAERIRRLYLDVPGGQIAPYKLHGERYANDVDGKPVLKKDNTRVKKSVIRVFVQVKYIIPGEDGKPVTVYVGGVSPEVKGQELEDRFYREPVARVVAEGPVNDDKSDEDAF
jgi:hypothetical protein